MLEKYLNETQQHATMIVEAVFEFSKVRFSETVVG